MTKQYIYNIKIRKIYSILTGPTEELLELKSSRFYIKKIKYGVRKHKPQFRFFYETRKK